MTLILVCGGRDYANRARVYEVLDAELAAIGRDDLLVMHGRCRTGADKFADDWCVDREVDCLSVPARWRIHGKPAGMIRNRRMSDVYSPDRVIAFPGGPGTRGMIVVAKASGIEPELVDFATN